jgi:thioredoxin-like negative regulator of GroEL
VQRGLPLLQKAAAALADVADVQLHYGVALGRAGQKKEGLAVLEKAASLEKDPAKHAAVQKQIDVLRGQL